MALLHPQLEAFLAVIEEGSFDRAAKRLCITPSALSQRIKGLEDRLGAVLVKRSVPSVATQAGEKLLRRAQSMRLLEEETLTDFRPGEGDETARLTILVNNDSLATWLPEALADFAAETKGECVSLELLTDDQDHALESLRNGTAIAVVTSEAHPVSGARATPLGAMRYIAVTSPALAASLGSVGFETSLQSAPVIFYDRKDTLQDRFLASFGIGPEAFTGLVHYAPSPTAMIDLAARGLGWCMAPESLAKPWIDRGQVVALAPEHAIDVPLYWQSSAIRSALLTRLGAVIRKTAAKRLRPLSE